MSWGAPAPTHNCKAADCVLPHAANQQYCAGRAGAGYPLGVQLQHCSRQLFKSLELPPQQMTHTWQKPGVAGVGVAASGAWPRRKILQPRRNPGSDSRARAWLPVAGLWLHACPVCVGQGVAVWAAAAPPAPAVGRAGSHRLAADAGVREVVRGKPRTEQKSRELNRSPEWRWLSGGGTEPMESPVW